MDWENVNVCAQQNPKPAPNDAPDIQKLDTWSVLNGWNLQAHSCDTFQA